MSWELRSIAREILSTAEVECCPGPSLLRREASRYAKKTKYGNIAVVSKRARARQPSRTRIIYEKNDESYQIAEKAAEFLMKRRYYAVQRCIGAHPRKARILALVDQEYPHLALMAHLNFFPCEEEGEPDIITVDSPVYPDTWILVERPSDTTFILGSDYYGELKMSFLRLAMNDSRDEHCSPGLHAGSKLYRIRRNGALSEVGVLIFGLSGTGKTTLTLESHNLHSPEGAWLRQDDIVLLTPQGRAHGTEMNLYPKTDSVPELPPLQPAVLHQDAVLENVIVREDGTPDFSDLSLTPNARALAIREAIPLTDGRVDLDHVDILVFLTRRPEMPPLARLVTAEQAAAYFLLGESFRTSAEAGKPEPVRVPGFDPFMLEPRWRTGLILLYLIEKLGLDVYIMNTGSVKDKKVPPSMSKHLLISAVKGDVVWRKDEHTGFEVAVKAGGLTLDEYLPNNRYGAEYAKVVEELRKERIAFLTSTFPKLAFLANYI